MSAQNRTLKHPVAVGTFRVEIEGVVTLGFATCRGLRGTNEFLQVQEGGVLSPRLFREVTHWEPLLLERIYDAHTSLWDWFEKGDPRSGLISLMASEGAVVGRWEFYRGRPSRWWAPELDATQPSVALEALEIIHEGVTWAT